MDCALSKKFKIGDKVVCIKDFYWENKLLFLADRFYFIRNLENFHDYDLVKIDGTYFATENISNFYYCFSNYVFGKLFFFLCKS